MNDFEEQYERLVDIARAESSKKNVPGVALGVLHDDQVYNTGIGVTSLENPTLVSPETLFQIGSITKTFTAAMVMQLIQDGNLSLDTQVQTVIPEFKTQDSEISPQVTVRDLLTHQVGWEGELFVDTGDGEEYAAKFLEKLANSPQVSPFRSTFSYNNSSFMILGIMLERLTGKTYRTLLREKIAEPVGIEHLYVDPRDVMTHQFAVGHQLTPEGNTVARPWHLTRSAFGAGAIVSCVDDILAYARVFLEDGQSTSGETILAPATIHQMHTPVVTINQQEHMGLAWFVDRYGDFTMCHHGGATNGQMAFLGIIPDHKLAFVFLTNGSSGRELNRRLTEHILKEWYGVDMFSPKPVNLPALESLKEFAGVYSRPFADVHVGVLGGRLIAQWIFRGGFPDEQSPLTPAPPPATLALCEGDFLKVADGPSRGARVDVLRDRDGQIAYLRFGMRLHQKTE